MGLFDSFGSSGGFPSLSSLSGGGFQPGGILGGAGQGSSWSMPDLGAAWSGGGTGSSQAMGGNDFGSSGGGFPSLASLGSSFGSYNPGSFTGDFNSGSVSLPSWTLPTTTGSAPSSAAGTPFSFGGLSGTVPRLGDGQIGGGSLNWGGGPTTGSPAPISFPSLAGLFGSQGAGAAGGGMTGGAPGSSLGGFQPGGILGSAGQGTTGLGGFQMPGGFSSALAGLFGGASPATQPTAAGGMGAGAAGGNSGSQAPSGTLLNTAPAGSVSSGGGSRTSPEALTSGNAAATNNARVTQGGVTYAPLANSNTTASASAPQLAYLGASVDPSKETKATDQYGRDFYYDPSVDKDGGGKVVGVSANGTIIKSVQKSDGSYTNYDTGATASQIRSPNSNKPAAGNPSVAIAPKNPPLGTAWGPQDAAKQRRDSGFDLQ